MYEIHLTRLALAIAATKYSIEAVMHKAREELDSLEIDDPTAIMMHCFRMPGSKDYEFICVPDDVDGIIVDTFSYVESDVFTKGPFEGKRVMLPTPDSFTNEDDDDLNLT